MSYASDALIDAQEREIEQLKADNAKLREVISDAEESARLILGESRALEAENAKLLDEKIDAYNDKVVAQLEADELRAENSKLRKRVAELDELLPENGRWYRAETVDAYVAENAKLRELVQGFLSEHADYLAEGNYFIGDLDLEHAMCHNQAYFRREAKKLGIEVDE